jgi:hypothetical protein
VNRAIPIIATLAVAVFYFSPASAQQSRDTSKLAVTKTDAQIKQAIIKESIAIYAGSCPCPYNVDRAGRSCGRRSAYSRPGGASPLCYADDVTAAMVKAYRTRSSEKAPMAATRSDAK